MYALTNVTGLQKSKTEGINNIGKEKLTVEGKARRSQHIRFQIFLPLNCPLWLVSSYLGYFCFPITHILFLWHTVTWVAGKRDRFSCFSLFSIVKKSSIFDLLKMTIMKSSSMQKLLAKTTFTWAWNIKELREISISVSGQEKEIPMTQSSSWPCKP